MKNRMIVYIDTGGSEIRIEVPCNSVSEYHEAQIIAHKMFIQMNDKDICPFIYK